MKGEKRCPRAELYLIPEILKERKQKDDEDDFHFLPESLSPK